MQLITLMKILAKRILLKLTRFAVDLLLKEFSFFFFSVYFSLKCFVTVVFLCHRPRRVDKILEEFYIKIYDYNWNKNSS